MDPLTIAALVEQLVTLGIQIYSQIEANAAASGTPVKPLADILAAADANFDKIQAVANAEITA